MRKSIAILALALLAAVATYGQEFRKFKVGIGLGYAVPSDGEAGVLLYLEPMYRIMDNIAVGLRMESAALVGQPPSGVITTLSIQSVNSYTLNGQYYFGNGAFRPFAGFGLGMFSVAAASADIAGSSVALGAATTSIGFYPRIGFDLGHFNVSADYNIIPAQETDINLGGLALVKYTQNFSYIAIRVGASIGGGKK